MQKNIIFLLFFFLLHIVAIHKTIAQTNNDFEMYYFEDSYGKHSFASVKEEKFKLTPNNFVNLGITKSTLWVKLKLNTATLAPNTVLIAETAFKDEITLSYYLKDQTNIIEKLGVMHPHSKNKFNHHFPAFNIPIKNLRDSVIYIKITSRWSLFTAITLKAIKPFNKERVNYYFLAGLLIGGITLLGFYNLFLFFSTSDYSYLLYVISLFSTILSQGYIYGFLGPYLSPEFTEVTFRIPLFLMANTAIFGCLFTIRFLEIKKTSKFLYYALIFIIAMALFDVCLELLNLYYLSRKINILLVISVAIVIFSSSLYSLIKGQKIALYFTLAWTFYLLGIAVYSLKTIGIIPTNNFTTYLMPIGTFMEVVLLSFALGHKYKLIQTEKNRLELQTREDLEILVKEQTISLQTSLKEKEILLKEVHHRVKNNLQIIISLLDLQVASLDDIKNKEIIRQSKSRVYSMSLIHQKLYQSNNLAQVNIKNYLEELFIYLQNSYILTSEKISYVSTIESKELSITQSVPIGLIVNELLSNSFKHAVQKDINNVIKVSFSFHQNIGVLEIADSGLGFDENEKQQGVKKSLGLFLIKSLTKQLKATIIRYHNQEEGLFVTKITIPINSII